MTENLKAARAATRSALFGAIEAQRDKLTAHSDSDEQLGTLSAASVEALVASGVLRMKLPRVLGGFEADLVTQMEVLERLAMINPSVGWCAMVGATSLGLPGAFLPDAGVACMFADGRIPRGAIVVTPSGLATAVDGGYRLTGRWGFASGVRHSEWLVALCRVERVAAAPPEIHCMVLPTRDCEILDNWQVVGLKGTGSCDIVVSDVFVPASMTFAVGDAPRRGGALYHIGLPAFVAYEHAGFALGIARRALDGLVTLMQNKKRGYAPGGTSMADRGAVQGLIGHSEMRLRAARALNVEINEHAWEVVCAGESLSLEEQCAVRSAATYATEVAAEVVGEAFRYGGASAIYEGHFMQRCLRDVSVAAQHYMVADTAYEQLGRARLGFADINPMG
jgi:alkylation response protein AidB-like acyl-CoA dehydrogenase